MRLFALFLLFFSSLYAEVRDVNIVPSATSKRLMSIQILDQKQLSYTRLFGLKFAELSDLAYDTSEGVLYMLSDKGILFAFEASFGQKIERLTPLRGAKLTNKKGKRFKKWKRDSEGMTLDGKGRLLISFEGKAKIGWFHKNGSAFGKLIRKYKLPKVLRSVKNYRSKNKSLESLAWHARHGVLTAAEWPLQKADKKKQTIYALRGKQWHFRAEPEGRSGLVAMEVMDDGNILVMERSYTGLMQPLVITLKKVYLNRCNKGMCESRVLAKMSSHEGWELDNFEGLAKVGKNRYVMISDDGENFFQRTLLIYFEVLER